MSDKKEMAISYENALMVAKIIKQKSDEEAARIIQNIAEVAQDKIITYIKEVKEK